MRGILAVGLSALLLGGCAGAALVVGGAGTGVAMGTGVEQTLSGITYKTFTNPIGEVHTATLRTLDRMDMRMTGDSKTPEGRAITATAAGRTIEIELERLTPNTTRMRVKAIKDDSMIFTDASTATEIILQTAQTVDEIATTARPATPAKSQTKGGKRI